MKLFYCPSYKGFVYTGLDKSKTVLINERTVDTKELVEYIELHTGTITENHSEAERFSLYHKLLAEYATKNPSLGISASFNADSLKVTEELLKWRDMLVEAGWNENTEAPSKRIEVLKNIEKRFRMKSFPEKVMYLTELINEKKIILPNDLSITVPFDYTCFKPYERKLLEAIGKERITLIKNERKESNLSRVSDFLEKDIEFTASENDGSFEIWQFEEKTDSFQFLSSLDDDEFDLWINRDNRILDSYLSMESKPVAGSLLKGFPRISQLAVTALGTMFRPLDIYNLIEWLDVPLSPFNYDFRKKLLKAVIKNSAYYNDECRNVLKEFENDFSDDIKTFLPSISIADETAVSKEYLLNFIRKLEDFAKRKMFSIDCEKTIEQLQTVVNHCESIILICSDSAKEYFSNVDIENLISFLYRDSSYTMYKAETGCRNVAENYADMACVSRKTVICDFYGTDEEPLAYSFLTKKEYDALSSSLEFWKRDDEMKYRMNIRLLPFKLTSEKLVLVTVEKNGTESVLKNADCIKLANFFGKTFDELGIRKSIQESDFKNASIYPPSLIDNRNPSSSVSISFKNTNLLKWRIEESASSLENLIQNPFDYAFENLAGIRPSALTEMPEVFTTHGNVAHKVIQNIFDVKDGVEGSGTVPFIKDCLDEKIERETLLTIQSMGSILLLKENILETETFKKQLKKCIHGLVRIMEENSLHVVACEKELLVEEMGFNPSISIRGFVDMILEDDEGKLYIFDFKWTRSENKHEQLLSKALSVQLVLYKELVKKLYKKEVKAAGYYVMPYMKFLTADAMKDGTKSVRVDDERIGKNVFNEIRNSYSYRRSQIEAGIIENADRVSSDLIEYCSETEARGLLPLKIDDSSKNHKKKDNIYSKCPLFKEMK